MFMNMSETDFELLARYTRHHAEDAFAEIVRRHIDLVHSAAMRQVRSAPLAEEVAQAAFLKLAQHARRLTSGTILSAWLYQVTRREAIDVVRREARRQLREQIATEMNATNSNSADWTHIEPMLDEAMLELDMPDRTAVLLRYFENKSLREVGETLGATENAVQKRLARAIEHLREFFTKRGVSIGESGLAAVLSAHSINAAPAGLSAMISTSAAIAIGSGLASTAPLAITSKAIAMTTIQKSLAATLLAVAVGVGVYQLREVSRLRAENEALRRQSAEKQLQQSAVDPDQAATRERALQSENDRLKLAVSELPKLRAELTRLRSAEQELTKLRKNNATTPVGETSKAPTTAVTEVPTEVWTNAGFATPLAALQTRGWSILNGNRERFAESVMITDQARKAFEDVIIQMAEASTDPNKGRYIEEVLKNKYGVEEAILMPMMAEHEKLTYKGYHVVSQQYPSGDEAILELEMRTASGAPKSETMKFRKVGESWKIVIDESLLKR